MKSFLFILKEKLILELIIFNIFSSSAIFLQIISCIYKIFEERYLEENIAPCFFAIKYLNNLKLHV